MFSNPVIHNQHLSIDAGEKIKSPTIDDFRFQIVTLRNEKSKKEMAMY